MMKIFIGIGDTLGHKLTSKGDTPTFNEVSDYLANMWNGEYLGIWKSEEGKTYIEQSMVLEFVESKLWAIKQQFPNEEAFYVAEIGGLVTSTYQSNEDMIQKAIESLGKGDGVTFQIIEGTLFQVITTNGRLIQCK